MKLMGKWKECTIADIGTVIGGATPSTKKIENYENGKIPWITPKDLSNYSERYILHGERNITEKGLHSCCTQLMPPNTVLFTSRAPIGYIAIAKGEICTNQGFKSVVPNEDTDFLFLYYLLKYNKKNIENMGTGTTFKEVSGNTMKKIRVRVPVSYQEQRAIGSFLGAIDDKIEHNSRINNNLEQQMQSIFKNIFPNILSKNCQNTLGEILSFSNGKKRPIGEGKIPVYGGNGILAYATASNAKNCIIIGRVGAYCGSLYYSADECWISDNAIVAYDAHFDNPIFAFYLLKNAALPTRHIGTSQPLLTQAILNAIPISRPETDSIENFIKLCSPLQNMVDANIAENIKLSEIRDTILPKLMRGEIDVSTASF